MKVSSDPSERFCPHKKSLYYRKFNTLVIMVNFIIIIIIITIIIVFFVVLI